jgi:peptidoglycan/LPS O-acetylase OafA/YrhL
MATSAKTISNPAALAGADGARYAATVPNDIAGLHIGALDGIRGLAILAVLIFHYGRSAGTFGFEHPLLKLTGIGWCGVDLFFVLSGFLITGILYDSRGSQHFFRNFYARRALRIFPLYYGVLLLVAVLSVLWADAGVWPTTSLWWIAAYLTNAVMAFDGAETPGILTHYWSLAIEEHFYLVWPFVVAMVQRRGLMMIAAGMVVFALGLRILALRQGLDPGAIYVLTPMRVDALAAGAFCALAVRGPGGVAPFTRTAWLALLGGGGAMLALIVSRHTVFSLDPGMVTIGYTLLAIAFAGALVVGITWAPLNAVLSSGVLRWFGRYSYGLYVWHVVINVLLFYTPIKAGLGIDEPAENLAYLFVALCIVLLTAFLSYNLFEKRLLNLKKHFH